MDCCLLTVGALIRRRLSLARSFYECVLARNECGFAAPQCGEAPPHRQCILWFGGYASGLTSRPGAASDKKSP
jgi:hypothetical protein